MDDNDITILLKAIYIYISSSVKLLFESSNIYIGLSMLFTIIGTYKMSLF